MVRVGSVDAIDGSMGLNRDSELLGDGTNSRLGER